MTRISNKQMYFIFTFPKIDYYDSAIGIKELSQKLNRPTQSVKMSIKNLGRKKFILKDKDRNEYLIICEDEMNKR